MRISTLHWQETIAKDYITQLGGSKSGAYHYLNDSQPDLRKHLPTDTKYLGPDGDVEKFLQGIDYSKPKVVRCCHALDFVGMVDVIDTKKDIKGKAEVRKAIEAVLTQAQNPDVRSFVEYESGETFDGKIGILVQDYFGEERGSIIEHPHMKGIYRVGKVTPTIMFNFAQTTVGKYNVDEEIFDRDGRTIDQFGVNTNGSFDFGSCEAIEEDEARKIIELYRKVADSGLIPEGYSFQMEYGIDQITKEPIFYQARLFLIYAI